MFHELLNAEKFVDVTLACEHNSLKCHKVRPTRCHHEPNPNAQLMSICLLGRVISVLIVFPETSYRESVQASDHHHAAGSRIRRPSIHHRVCLSRRNRRLRSRVASE